MSESQFAETPPSVHTGQHYQRPQRPSLCGFSTCKDWQPSTQHPARPAHGQQGSLTPADFHFQSHSLPFYPPPSRQPTRSPGGRDPAALSFHRCIMLYTSGQTKATATGNGMRNQEVLIWLKSQHCPPPKTQAVRASSRRGVTMTSPHQESQPLL